jgi:hypothetical protein
MWTPVSLALATLNLAASVPRALNSVARADDLLERAIAEAQSLNRSAADARGLLSAGLELMDAGLGRMDAMNERADLVLQELAEAREVFAAAMLKFDHGTRELTAAREQLRESQGVLAEANDRVGRAIEMAEPIDRMTTRAAKIAGSLRRDSGDAG